MVGDEEVVMIAVFQIPFLVVAILLVRAVRNWATITLLVGTCCLVLAAVIIAVIANVIPSGPRYEGLYYSLAGAGLAGLGYLACLVGACGAALKYAATARRAEEVEGLLRTLQDRMGSGPTLMEAGSQPSIIGMARTKEGG
tara:strand:+ start:59 stop:481 length:423 start_codon:yes stop_codon:yes gene_type:complete